jgi:hypothetical protein
LRWALLKDRSKLSREQAIDLDRLVIQFTSKRTARAWLYRERLRNRAVVHQCHAFQGRAHEGSRRHEIVAWARSRQTNGFIEALHGLFQAAKRKARGYTRIQTMKTVLFLIAGKLNFSAISPHAA